MEDKKTLQNKLLWTAGRIKTLSAQLKAATNDIDDLPATIINDLVTNLQSMIDRYHRTLENLCKADQDTAVLMADEPVVLSDTDDNEGFEVTFLHLHRTEPYGIRTSKY